MLGTDDAPRTTGERYISASNTSDLTVDTRQEGARNTADILVAAGMTLVRRHRPGEAPETFEQHRSRTAYLAFGAALLKLRSEYDGAVRLRAGLELKLGELDRKTGETPEAHKLRTDMRKREAERQNYSERLQMLNALPSLQAVKAGAQTWLEARKQPQSVAAEVIYYWLDKTCIACNGQRWKAVNHRLTAQACPACNGLGERIMRKIPAADWLHDHMQRAAGEFPPAAQRKMR